MKKRKRFSKYDKMIVQGIIHGYHRLADIQRYLSRRIEKNITVYEVSQYLRLLLQKGVLYNASDLDEKKTWKYHFEVHPSNVLYLFDKELMKSKGKYVSVKLPLIIVQDTNCDKDAFCLSVIEVAKELLVMKVLINYSCSYIKVLKQWIEKDIYPKLNESKVDYLDSETGQLIDSQTIILSEIEKVLGRRDYYLYLAIEYLLNPRVKLYSYLLNLKPFTSLEKAEELIDLEVPCKLEKVSDVDVKIALEELSNLFDIQKDRKIIIGSQQVILI